jgi:hypothetical protein
MTRAGKASIEALTMKETAGAFQVSRQHFHDLIVDDADEHNLYPAFVSPSWMAHEAQLFMRTLHDLDGFVRFWIASGDRPHDRYELVVDAPRAAMGYAGETDVYVSLGAYRFPRGPMAGIRTLHVDLDFYKVPAWSRSKPNDVLVAVLEVLNKANIPSPGLAVATGRGLQLVWLVQPVKLRAAPKAKAAMRALVKLLAAFGADPACTDLERVFRLPGSMNSKNGQFARLLHYEQHRHDFDVLCLAILGPRKEAPQTSRKPKTVSAKRAENRSLVHLRLADLQKLILARWSGKVPEGYRSQVAHLAAVHLVQLAGDPIERTAAWCAKWTDGLPMADIKRIVASVVRNKARRGGYRYKGLTIGERLDVTADEVQRLQLQTIYAATDTAEEIDQRRRTRRAQAKRQTRKAAGAKPQAESARRRKPWKELGISRATFYRQQSRNRCETISAPLYPVSSETPLQQVMGG